MSLSLLGIVVAGVLSSGALVALNMLPPKISRKGRWQVAPFIFVDTSLSPAYFEATREAVKAWRDRGHPIHDPALGELPLDKAGMPGPGLVYVCADMNVGGSMSLEHAGHTTWALDRDGVISRAKVRLPPDLTVDQMRRVIEHELGHALGYEHARRQNHVMSTVDSWHNRDDRGLEGP